MPVFLFEVQRKRYEEDEEYRITKQEYNKSVHSRIVSCSVCNCSMTQANYYKHKKTDKHQRNLEKGSSLVSIEMNEIIVY